MPQIGAQTGYHPSTVQEYMRRFGIPARTPAEGFRSQMERHRVKFKKGPEHPLWKGVRKRAGGYVRVHCPEHTRANKEGFVLEHILEWEKAHNKPLPVGYIIHHLNGIKDDNRPENLVALFPKRHSLILAAKAKRIRELEIRVKALLEALETHQGIFNGYL